MSGSESRKRLTRIDLRCDAAEKEALRQKAADCGMSLSMFILEAACGRTIRSRVDDQVINELRRLGGLQKYLFKEGGGQLSKEYSDVLLAIQSAIVRIAG